jgi:hypothetical protein
LVTHTLFYKVFLSKEQIGKEKNKEMELKKKKKKKRREERK